MIASDATTSSETINGSRKNESPNPIEPINNPIAIPMIGKMCMYLATVSRLVLLEGIIVRNEKTELISLSMYPPS
jgi:hypothetical protein